MKADMPMLKDVSTYASNLLTSVLEKHHYVKGVDGTNPNALSILLADEGVPVSDEFARALKECLIYGCVPGTDGYWVSFFPHKVEGVDLTSEAEEGVSQ